VINFGTAGVVRGVIPIKSLDKFRESLVVVNTQSYMMTFLTYICLSRSMWRVSGFGLSNFIDWGNFIFSSRTTISFALPSSVGVCSDSKVGGGPSDGGGED
jgi:hypothetical protein